DAKICDASLPDLSDLRILDRSLSEIGLAVRVESGTPEAVKYEPKIYNRSYVPGKSASVTLDFGTPAMRDTLVVRTGGESFRRPVRIEASDDANHWSVLREDGLLIAVPSSGGRDTFEKERIDLPPGDRRFLRVTVFHNTGDPPRIEIVAVHAELSRSRPPTLEPVPLDIVSTRADDKEKFPELRVDTDARNRPRYSIRFAFEDTSFQRQARVDGRNDEMETVRVRREDAPELEVKREAPWIPLASGTLYRIRL